MEKLAYKTTGPLQETTRQNIRAQVDDSGEEVFFLRKRPLSSSEWRLSPKQGDKTFLLVEDQKMKPDVEEQLKSLKEQLEKVNEKVVFLEEKVVFFEEVCNYQLYEPLYGHRVQAAVSLMTLVRYKLDEFVEAAIAKEAKYVKGQVERDEFKHKFESKSSYIQLMGSSDPVVAKIVKSAEKSLLTFYTQQGIQVSQNIDVKGSMHAFKKVKRRRDQTGAHVFDYDYDDVSRAHTEERKDSWTIQARILKDIEKAIEKGWLPELTNPAKESLLHLEVQRKISELEAISRCTITELANMPYRVASRNQKRSKVEAKEGEAASSLKQFVPGE